MILSVENGCFSYDKKHNNPILENISFEAKPSDLIAILGPNGSGKTTLLRCIMGFLHWNSGKSCLDGKDIRSMPHNELWKNIAYVPQAKNTSTAFTAEEMILLGRSSHFGMMSTPSPDDIAQVNYVMKRLHIEKLAKKKCSEISGGELQMILIARALVSEPQILILDEPESNLDFKNQLIILETMSELVADGMTCIFNTHYPAHALQRANKALLLSHEGDSVFGDIKDIITESNIEAAFGVKAIINEVETPFNMMQNVIPLHLSAIEQSSISINTNANSDIQDFKYTIAVIAVISNDYNMADKINHIFHEYNKYLIGRMGMPYDDHRVFIFNITLDAPANVIDTLCNRLSLLPGVSAKATYQSTF